MSVNNSKVVILKRRKKSGKSFIIYFFLCFLLIFFLLSFIFSNKYVIAGINRVSDFMQTEGIIIKNEKVITSPYRGKIEYLVKSGERVRVGTPLFKVITDFEMTKKIEEDVSNLKKQLEDEKNSSIPVLETLNKSIDELEKNLYSGKGKDEDKLKLKAKLKSLYEERERLLKERQKNIEIIQENISELENKRSLIEPVIYSPISGIVSFCLDGFEEKLSLGKEDELGKIDFFSVNNMDTNIEKKDYVEENEKVLKIIDNFNIYILAECKEKNLKKGRFYNMESSSGENFSAKLEKILGNGRLLFFVNEDLPGLYEKRKEKFKIILQGYEGITLPKSAIIRVGDKDGVFIKERDKLIYKPVEVIFEEGENVVVGGVKPGDIILVKRGLLWNFKEVLMNFF